MRRVVLLALLALALPTAALADTIDYANLGSVGSGTAIISGSATAGSTYSLTSQLVMVKDETTNVTTSGALGWVNVTTGTLSACPAGLCFTGGTLTVTSAGGATLFQGTFTNGVVTVNPLSPGILSVTAFLGTAGGTAQFVFNVGQTGIVSGDTVVTPEPGTLGLLGTGLVGLAGIVRRKLRA
jgi:hypothetical protein